MYAVVEVRTVLILGLFSSCKLSLFLSSLVAMWFHTIGRSGFAF